MTSVVFVPWRRRQQLPQKPRSHRDTLSLAPTLMSTGLSLIKTRVFCYVGEWVILRPSLNMSQDPRVHIFKEVAT